jgi:hypothetical protein
MEIARGGQGVPVIPVPFTILCYWVNETKSIGKLIAPSQFNN